MESYIKIKKIVSGCKTKMDAINLGTELKLISDKIFLNIINSCDFSNEYSDIKNFNCLLNECIKCDHIEDVKFLVSNHDKKLDDIQLKTLEYLTNMKDHRVSGSTFVEKNCPHCGHKTIRDCKTTYIVCGYPNDVDYGGCGMDWCFKCGKKLCKKWDVDMLYVESNQSHDSSCCKSYAMKRKLDYDNEFCKCTNNNVNRKC